MRLRILAAAIAALFVLPASALAADNYPVTERGGGLQVKCAKDIGSDVVSDCASVLDENHALISPAVKPLAGTVTVTITRPPDTAPYLADDAWSDSTSAPTSGGFTLAGVCRADGKSGRLTGLSVVSSNPAATPLAGEMWIADGAITAINDNAAFALSDSDALKIIPGGIIPFQLAATASTSNANTLYAQNGLAIPYTCSGSANLRFNVKVKNGYTPVSGETLTFRVAYETVN